MSHAEKLKNPKYEGIYSGKNISARYLCDFSIFTKTLNFETLFIRLYLFRKLPVNEYYSSKTNAF